VKEKRKGKAEAKLKSFETRAKEINLYKLCHIYAYHGQREYLKYLKRFKKANQALENFGVFTDYMKENFNRDYFTDLEVKYRLSN